MNANAQYELIETTLAIESEKLSEPAASLYDALWQILDDMGTDGTGCCTAAKFQGLDALRVAMGKGRVFEEQYRI